MKQKLDAEDKNKSDLCFYQQMPWCLPELVVRTVFITHRFFLIPFYGNWKEDA